jgi:hypothetical protein
MDNTTEHEVQQDAKYLHLLLFIITILIDVKIRKEQTTPMGTIKILCRRYE